MFLIFHFLTHSGNVIEIYLVKLISMKQKKTKRYGLFMVTTLLWVWWIFDPSINSDVTVIYELSLLFPLTATLFLVKDIYTRGWFPEAVPWTDLYKDTSNKKIAFLILIGVIIYSIYTIYMYRDQLNWLFG